MPNTYTNTNSSYSNTKSNAYYVLVINH